MKQEKYYVPSNKKLQKVESMMTKKEKIISSLLEEKLGN